MDLVYGHLGPPVYDTESKTWHFARNPQSQRYFHPICPLFRDLATEQHALAEPEAQQQLLTAYPEFGGSFSLEDARLSEVVSKCMSQYDPAVSDLLAIGNAVDTTHPKAMKELHYKQIIVLASGAAGELVRLVVLNRKYLKWESSEKLKLESLTAQNGEEGWWKGNGSPIQQLVFAGSEKQGSTWLAVRYLSALSVLKPVLHSGMICPSNAEGQIHDLPASRLDANHIITLNPQDASGMPFADVTFNPWDPEQFATIDQGCRWHIWKIKAQNKIHGLWTFENICSGSAVDDKNPNHDLSESILDSWARLLWVGNAETVVIAYRRNIAVFDVRTKPVTLDASDLELSKSSDWILDMKRTPGNVGHLLVVTSSRLFMLEIRPVVRGEKSLAGAAILVSWVHFRSPEDISLSLSCFDCSEPGEASQRENTTAVVVYSRLNNLATVFTFQHFDSTGHAISKSDPCLLPIPGEAIVSSEFQQTRNDTQAPSRLLCLQMTPFPMMNARRSNHQEISEERSPFFLLRILSHNKSLSEHLYVESPLEMQSRVPPDTQGFVGRKKTPARVNDDFIVADGVVEESEVAECIDSEVNALLTSTETSKQRRMTSIGFDTLIDQSETQTLEMGWLVAAIDDKRHSWRSQSFEDCLGVVQIAIDTKLASTESGAETLAELSKAEPVVTDIDTAADALSVLLESIPQSPSNAGKAVETATERREIVLAGPSQALSVALGLDPDFHLSQVYESLIVSQIGPIPSETPSRVRIAMEKQLRALAAQLCLAAFTVHINIEAIDPKVPTEPELPTQDSTFSIPVRRKGPAVSLTGGRKEVVKPSSLQTKPSAPFPESSASQNMPTSNFQATPLQSTTAEYSASQQTFSEDPSSINLRTLVSLAPQPLLPAKLSNILTHWNVGEDPQTYDWNAAQRATALPNSEAIAAEQARLEKAAKKAKKRAKISTLLARRDAPYAYAVEGDVQTQPEPQSVMEPKSQAITVGSSQIPESSQMGAAISSQPLAGRFAGGQKGLKAKKGRKKGF